MKNVSIQWYWSHNLRFLVRRTNWRDDQLGCIQLKVNITCMWIKINTGHINMIIFCLVITLCQRQKIHNGQKTQFLNYWFILQLFSETAVGCTASYFVKIIWCSCWFCNPPPPPPYFEAEYCLFCGRRRVAVARYRMICLVLAIYNQIFPTLLTTSFYL